jgi:2Fe-2S ferredoxin
MAERASRQAGPECGVGVSVVTFVGADGTPHERDIREGVSVMAIARATGVPGIIAECGGNLTCASCHVIVDEDWAGRFTGPSDDEAEMLEEVAAERRPTSRLSCQLVLDDSLDGIVVQVPERQR